MVKFYLQNTEVIATEVRSDCKYIHEKEVERNKLLRSGKTQASKIFKQMAKFMSKSRHDNIYLQVLKGYEPTPIHVEI